MTQTAKKKKRDPEGTRRRILEAAMEEFRLGGLAGARVDCIARRAATNERMLYYYFGSKEKLFIAVLESVFEDFIHAHGQLQLEALQPDDAIIAYARFIWDYYAMHPEVIRLVNNENLHQGRHLRRSVVRESFAPVLTVLKRILERGSRLRVFRDDVDPMHFYLSISALGFYIISNRYTLSATFGEDFMVEQQRDGITAQHADMLLAYLHSL